MPPLQMSLVHVFVSNGASLSSTTLWGLPATHRIVWQSPAVCPLEVAFPSLMLWTPQVLALQVRCWHSVSEPQSEGAMHTTHAPLPSQRLAPLLPLHDCRASFGGWEAVPLVQMSSVQALPSDGASLLSTTLAAAPCPLHRISWQS